MPKWLIDTWYGNQLVGGWCGVGGGNVVVVEVLLGKMSSTRGWATTEDGTWFFSSEGVSDWVGANKLKMDLCEEAKVLCRVYGAHYVADLRLSRVDSSRSDVANWGRCRRHLRRNWNFNSFIISMCCLQFIFSASNVSASMSVSLEDNYPACQLCSLSLSSSDEANFFDQCLYYELLTSRMTRE